MPNVKRCVQCGILKDESEFRRYKYSVLKHTEGRYRICRACEAINANYKQSKVWVETHKYGDDPDKFNRINGFVVNTEQLYKTLEAKGLRVPAAVATEPRVKDDSFEQVQQLLQFHMSTSPQPAIQEELHKATVPDELQQWLNISPAVWIEEDISPEYLQETVYESLKAKYRPQIGVDRETYLPIYDDTYKQILNMILRKFDDYEENYVPKE